MRFVCGQVGGYKLVDAPALARYRVHRPTKLGAVRYFLAPFLVRFFSPLSKMSWNSLGRCQYSVFKKYAESKLTSIALIYPLIFSSAF